MPEYWIYTRTTTYTPTPRKSKAPLVVAAIVIAIIVAASDDKKKHPAAQQEQPLMQEPQQQEQPPAPVLKVDGARSPSTDTPFEFGR